MKLSDERLQGLTTSVFEYPDCLEMNNMARELLQLRKDIKSFYITQEFHVEMIDELTAELAAAEKVVEESRLLESDGFLRYEQALEAYDKVVKS